MSNVDFASLFIDTPESVGSLRPKLDVAGTYKVKIVEASYAQNLAKTAYRTLVKVEVVEGEKATALKNLYINAGKDHAQSIKNALPYYHTLVNAGVDAAKITDESGNDFEIVLQNIATIITRQIKQGKELFLTLQLKPNDKKEGEFWANVFQYKAPATPIADLPDATTKVVKKAPKVKVPEATPEAVGINAVVEAKVAKTVEAEDDDMSWIDE